MRTTSLLGSFLALSLAPACGSDSKPAIPDAAVSIDAPAPTIDATPEPDAAPADLGCAGAALPDTAADPLTLTGTTNTISGLSIGPVGGILVEAYAIGNGTPLASDTSKTGGGVLGNFSLTAASGGVPLDGYLKATAAGKLDAYLYPPYPIANDLTMLLTLIVDQGAVDLLGTVSGVTQDPTNGILIVGALDCTGAFMGSAQITSSSGTVVYLGDNGAPDQGRTETSAQGAAIVFNAAPGDVVIGGSRLGTPLRTHTVQSVAGALTSTVAVP